MKILISVVMVLMMLGNVHAEYQDTELSEQDRQAINKAQQKLKATFIRMAVKEFGESPLPGIYEVVTGNGVIYFHPEKELLIFGEIYTKDGRSLTQTRLQESQNNRVAELNLEEALVVGSGPKKIVEFTDPECLFCQKYHTYIEEMASKVTRYIFFTPIRKIHPNAANKAIHILCAKNKKQALDEIYNNRLSNGQLTTCKYGEEMLARHEQISSHFGVQATPTLVLENAVITGLNQAQIAQYINQ